VKAFIVYDSKWGNTESIAKAIAEGVGGSTKAVRATEAHTIENNDIELLVIGSPVIGGRPSKTIQEYLQSISPPKSGKMRIATFDTRMTMKFAQKFGHAAERMADQLKENGFILIDPPKGFIVNGQKGPLAEGEMEKATQWGKELAMMHFPGR
jgi:flavodoxin